jgi:ABC-type dipeptide/oligopeptide/nickel transport system permease component
MRCWPRLSDDPAVILLFSSSVMINLSVDMIYTILDPRIRY